MTTPFAEDLVQGMVATLQANMPTQVTAVANKYAAADSGAGRTIPLIAPKAYLFGEHHNLGADSPVIVCWAEDLMILHNGTVSTVSNGSWADYHAMVYVDVHLQSDDEDVAERQVERYREAVWNTIYANQDLGVGAISATPKRSARVKLDVAGARVLRWEIEVEFFPQF